MTMSFDLQKALDNGGRCQTRDGRPARIICTDRNCPSAPPLIVLVDNGGSEIIHTNEADGKRIRGGDSDHPFDLINAPVKRSGWMNVYPPCWDGFRGTIWDAKESADKWASSERLACIPIEWEEPA